MALERTFKNYTGGKAGDGTYQKIISCIPKCDVWVDAFAGGMGVTTHLSLPDLTIVNDIDVSVFGELCRVSDHVFGCIPMNLHYQQLWELVKYLAKDRVVCMYCDPPYLFGTRATERRYYKYEWEDHQHEDFYKFLLSTWSNEVLVLFSHYPCDFYNRLLDRGWRYIDFNSMTRGGVRVERLYMNFPEPLHLQDVRYVGKNFTDRQRLQRKGKRWVDKFMSMPAAERDYIFSMLQESK